MFGGERKFSDETSSDSDSLHFTAISSDSNPEMNEQSGRKMFLGAFMRNTSEKSVFEDFEDEDFILIRPPSPSDVSIQAESCGFISKEDLSAANSRSSLPNANHVPTSSNVSSLFIESSSKPIRLEPAYDNSNESSCWPVNQSSPKSQARGANFGGLQLRSRVKVFSEAMVKTYLINPASGDLTSSEFPDKFCLAQETFDHSSKTDAIITRDEAGGLDDEVSLPETDEDESCNLFRKSEDASKINPEELVDAVDVNNATSPFVGKQTSFDEDAGGETDQRKEIEKQENERPFGDSGETNEIDGLVGTQIVDGGNDNEAQHSFQEIANEERVEGNHDDGIVEHGSTYSLPFAAASRISCGPLGDIITKSAESLPNLINFVENVLSITENECHKSLLQSILSLTFLIKSRINDHQKSPEIVANLEELSAHLKGQLGMP